ncbi:hypothetical protein K437DRAFT_296767 [Tilletiaria anomala UBC 951]|uniref:VWFA domain-containing protein n=1 Tax=Tilletiaria anomala (strain ATCC 24038 / CBS 436.72 / UBC 951) TaxID=1037660 RepID=A0A066V510_TILAU|nr:uncharacterized protein K437DRAFT_296767 [Tilletiaria anomala UBC 951]KDN36561.1 hypothetical protein K437DRAFT_296767 [Tilletiaria anomala UBC 951]
MSDAPPPYQPYAQPSASSAQQRPQQQQLYAPPPGPPPQMGGDARLPPIPLHNPPPSHTSTSYPASYNPFSSHMNSSPNAQLQAAYPAMQPQSMQGYLPQGHPPHSYPPQGSQQQHPYPSADLQRVSSVTSHATNMNSAGNVGRVGSNSSMRAGEDPLDMLKDFDTIVIVDDSGSMQLSPEQGGPSRWEEARDALAGVVFLASQKDADGIDVHFLNSDRSLHNCTRPDEVKCLFDTIVPDGITPTGTKIEILMLEYLDQIEDFKQKKGAGLAQGKEPKKRNYVVITDGASSDDVESVIISIARRLDAGKFPLSQVGFSFIQCGDDPEATEALRELDDAIHQNGGVRDIVDTTPYSGMALNTELITKALLGGINRRYDRKDRRASTLR